MLKERCEAVERDDDDVVSRSRQAVLPMQLVWCGADGSIDAVAADAGGGGGGAGAGGEGRGR